MQAPDPADVQALMNVVDTITTREGLYGFLGSVKDLVHAGEPEAALDHLAGGLNGWHLQIALDEFAVLERLCHAWDTDDLIGDFGAVVMLNPSTDPQP